MSKKSKNIHVTTSTGFECWVDPAAGDDMELLDCLAELQDGNLLGYSKAATLLIGEKNKKRLYEHIKKFSDGRVPTRKFEAELMDIINGMGSKKK